MSSIDDSWKNFHVEKRNTKETALYILFSVGLLLRSIHRIRAQEDLSLVLKKRGHEIFPYINAAK